MLSITLSLWGAILSTVLAIIKFWEVRQEGVRLTTSYSFSTDPELGNEIVVENASKTPVMISYWELLWAQRAFGRTTINGGRFPEEGYCNITVGPHSRYALSFRDQQYFTWARATAEKGRLYLKLHVVGRRRPIWLHVYDPSK